MVHFFKFTNQKEVHSLQYQLVVDLLLKNGTTNPLQATYLVMANVVEH